MARRAWLARESFSYSSLFHGVGSDIVLIYNAPAPEMYLDLAPALPDDGAPRAVYVGNASFHRGFRELAEACRLARKRFPTLKYYIIGDVPAAEAAWLNEFRRTHSLADAIVAVGRVQLRKLGAYLRHAHVGLMGLQRNPNTELALAGKAFDYMACGLPMVASDFGATRQLVERCCCGVFADTSSPESIRRGIESILGNPELAKRLGEAGLAASAEVYGWRRMEERLFALYDRLADRKPGAR